MRFVKLFFLTVAALATLGFVQACSDDANADQAEVTQAEFDALEARVAELETAIQFVSAPRDTLYAPASSAAAKSGVFRAAKFGATDWVDIGTRLECLPTNDFFGKWCRVLSPKGYYGGLALGLGETYPMQAGRIFFEQVGCTGTPYMSYVDVAPDADVQGFVTGIYPAGLPTRAPESIYMFAAGSTVQENVTVLSFYEGENATCEAYTGPPDSFFGLVPNNPEISGFSNDNYGQLSLQP